jgi:hypothetical protein
MKISIDELECVLMMNKGGGAHTNVNKEITPAVEILMK